MNRRLLSLCAVLCTLLLAGCESDLLKPSGDIAVQQRDLLIQSTLLMLLIIIPVMILTVWFAWRYRAANTQATYDPEWNHSTQLELVIWAAPLLIIICLGALTWLGTHLLDPYRPISRLAAGQDIPEDAQTLQVDVVAMDWKWLFIYPQYGVATINELALPINRPVSLHITATSVMNSLYVPAFSGQVFAMPGMETRLHGVLNKPVTSKGFSANYSGAGFSGMRMSLRGMSASEFDAWVEQTRRDAKALTAERYLQLAKPSEREPVQYFASVESSLFHRILNRCVEPGKMCMNDMMAIDARGGLGMAGVYSVTQQPVLASGKSTTLQRFVTGVCKPGDLINTVRDEPVNRMSNVPLMGLGLRPGSMALTDERNAAL